MKILFAAQKHDYGKPERGLSYEYYNFFEPLVDMGHEVTFLDLGAGASTGGGMDAALQRAVSDSRPELLFTFLFGERSQFQLSLR